MTARWSLIGVACIAVVPVFGATAAPSVTRFVFTSDAHFGITRPAFRGGVNVNSRVVNHALVDRLTDVERFAGPIDFVVEGGDIANRSEISVAGGIQSAATSWQEFREEYLERLRLRASDGTRTPVYVVPGNHDLSNALGWHSPLRPATDPSSVVAIYNLMLAPRRPLTVDAYEGARDLIATTREVHGVHYVFLHLWPDSRMRSWLERDLQRVSATTPVVLFTHDQPDVEAKHLRNPNGDGGLDAQDRFENLLGDMLTDGTSIDDATVAEQRALAEFLQAHPNVVAYFHGNSNWNEFYDWHGPDNTLHLPVFRVDSPMKGRLSSRDETQLSFHVAEVDAHAATLTVRECLWNADPQHPSAPLVWGAQRTISLRPSAGHQ